MDELSVIDNLNKESIYIYFEVDDKVFRRVEFREITMDEINNIIDEYIYENPPKEKNSISRIFKVVSRGMGKAQTLCEILEIDRNII